MDAKTARIVLEDGAVFTGTLFGASGSNTGEVVFNTGMSGYQEILTDPSYRGQIVVMTYPLIGNYGITPEDNESAGIHLSGFAVREQSKIISNWRAEESLGGFLKKHNIIGIENIDTRALTRHIREKGAMKAIISSEDKSENELIQTAKNSPGLVGRDLVRDVTADKIYTYNEKGKYKVAVIDCGVKYNILRELKQAGCSVIVFPAQAEAAEILAINPDGIFISNGPGDPEGARYVAKTISAFAGKLPVFGICLGHQMLGLAFGGRTYKLKFGHHGCNHPVKDLRTGRILITAQNHGFCIRMKERGGKYYLDGNEDIEVTHINLNDNTCEGLRHRKLPVFAVQFHPEAAPGPHDAKYLFSEFTGMMKDYA